jgi:mRNA interferase HicA
MIKLRELQRHLFNHGCVLLREGSKHSVWLNPATGRRTTVPRHRELPLGTGRAICGQLGIPPVG